MAGYDPKAKRPHSPSPPHGPAPVRDLLGSPATPTPSAEVDPVPRPRASPPTPPPASRPLAPTPAAASGPDPKVLVAVLAGALAALLFWRHRRRT